ncbi:MAG TPA: pseudouridine synthase [Baekduia sp.]|nr:pseudouridine synthase [Baekduia sp.]
MRIAKYLAHAGVASRRASEEIIKAGRVTVDGEVVINLAQSIEDGQKVTVDGRPIAVVAKTEVWLINKPAGVVSTASDTHGRPTVVELVDSDHRLYPVGRLDADTTGLLLLTDDGELANLLTHPRYEVEKTYLAHVENGRLSEPELRRLRTGVNLDDGRTAPAKARQVEPGVVEITIHEGRKRQVKRMLEAVDHPVRSLSRISFGPLRLGTMREGGVRKLTPAEVQRLRDAAHT